VEEAAWLVRGGFPDLADPPPKLLKTTVRESDWHGEESARGVDASRARGILKGFITCD